MRDKLKDELAHLEELEKIKELSQPTEWVNAMAMVEKKDGSVRLCIDHVNLKENN